MEALYATGPKPEDLAAWGMVPDDLPPPDPYALWPDNWPAIHLFTQCSTQWRTGVNGPSGLDYNVIFHELDRRSLPEDEYDDLMGCIRVIETAALAELRKE